MHCDCTVQAESTSYINDSICTENYSFICLYKVSFGQLIFQNIELKGKYKIGTSKCTKKQTLLKKLK